MSDDQAPAPPPLIERCLSAPPLVRLAECLLHYPRITQVSVGLLGALSVGWILLTTPLAEPGHSALPGAGPGAVLASATPPISAEVLARLTAYNQASVVGGWSGDLAQLAPFLDPAGPAWAAARAEYARRAAAHERHRARLVRWAILRGEEHAGHALVETQEEWDDQTLVGQQPIDAQQGVLTRNLYALRHTAEGWLITHITSTLVMQ